MVRREYFAEFDLAFEPVPDAVNHTQTFEKVNGTIGGCAVDCWCAILG